MNDLIKTDSAETLEPEVISPEGLRVANAYLECGEDSATCAANLGMDVAEVDRILGNTHVKRYVDRLYFESGYRNRTRTAAIMDELLQQKLEELNETGMGTSLDIVELMEKMHKMKMAEMQMALKMAEMEHKTSSTNIRSQTNVQINGEGGGYQALLDQLLK